MFFEVEEPFNFYVDLVFIGAMLVIAVSVSACVAMQHRGAITRGMRAVQRALFPPPPSPDGEIVSTVSSGQQGGAKHVLTPGTFKTACRHVVRGFHEMV